MEILPGPEARPDDLWDGACIPGDWEGGVSDGCKEFGRLFSFSSAGRSGPVLGFQIRSQRQICAGFLRLPPVLPAVCWRCSLMEDCVERILL